MSSTPLDALPREAVCWRDLVELDCAAHGVRVATRRAQDTDQVGITGCYCAIAETGTLVLASGADTPSSASLVPETHIAVVRASLSASWLLRLGALDVVPTGIGPPASYEIEGDWDGAARWWAGLGCPYEEALALAEPLLAVPPATEPATIPRTAAPSSRFTREATALFGQVSVRGSVTVWGPTTTIYRRS